MATNAVMAKGGLVRFDLWGEYWYFLVSLTHVYEEELSKRLPGVEITTRIDSTNFFGPAGEVVGDYPELEEIYFGTADRKESVRLVIPHARTKNTYVEFCEEDNETYFAPKKNLPIPSTVTALVFSEECLQAAAGWLKKGWLNEFAHDNFQKNY